MVGISMDIENAGAGEEFAFEFNGSEIVDDPAVGAIYKAVKVT